MITNVDDMIQKFPVPEFVGMSSPWQNAGSMRNIGWELSLNWNDRVGDVSYFVRGNLSDVRNKVLDLYGLEYKETNSPPKDIPTATGTATSPTDSTSRRKTSITRL